MKKHISFLAILVVAMSLAACSDFLDVEAEGNVTTDNVLDNDQNAIDLIDGLYYKLSNDGDNLYGRTLMFEQAGANDIVWGRERSYPQLALNGASGDEDPLVEIFEDLYTVEQRANDVIYHLLEAERLSPLQSRSLGEAYFMRGLAHFLVAYRYGTKSLGVPFIRYEDYGDDFEYSIIPPQLESVTENYRLICEDFDKATELLPVFEDYDEADQGRAHKAAALGYKAKCLAYWACWEPSKWNDVISIVNTLETQYGRGLAENYADLFSADFSQFFNREYIFSIPGDGATNRGTEMVGVMLENQAWGMYNGWGFFKPTEDIYNEFLKDGDRESNIRLRTSMLAYNDEFQLFGTTRRYWSSADNESGFAISKFLAPFAFGSDGVPDYDYVNSNGDWPTARINYPLLRFADLLLLRAEAYLMTGQAANATTDINRIRQRAGLRVISGAATTADLYHERRCELAFELSDHLFDLKRWFVSGDATLKALAADELNNLPTVRNYADRTDPLSSFTSGCEYSQYAGRNGKRNAFADYMIAFPYPSDVIIESNLAYRQNAGY